MLCNKDSHPQQNKLSVLFDSGSSFSHIHRRALPSSVPLKAFDNPATSQTLAGTMTTRFYTEVDELIFPEFSPSLKVSSQKFNVFEQQCRYDAILGRDFLQNVGMELNFSEKNMKWADRVVPMKPPDWTATTTQPLHLSGRTGASAFMTNDLRQTSLVNGYDSTDALATFTYDRIHKGESVATIMKKQLHLSNDQRAALALVLSKFPTLFDGVLKSYKGKPVSLKFKPNSHPIHCKPYPCAWKDIENIKRN